MVLIMDSHNIKENAIRAHKYFGTSDYQVMMSLAVSIRRLFYRADINPEYQSGQNSFDLWIHHRSKAFYFILFKIPMFLQPFPGLLCSKRNPWNYFMANKKHIKKDGYHQFVSYFY